MKRLAPILFVLVALSCGRAPSVLEDPTSKAPAELERTQGTNRGAFRVEGPARPVLGPLLAKLVPCKECNNVWRNRSVALSAQEPVRTPAWIELTCTGDSTKGTVVQVDSEVRVVLEDRDAMSLSYTALSPVSLKPRGKPLLIGVLGEIPAVAALDPGRVATVADDGVIRVLPGDTAFRLAEHENGPRVPLTEGAWSNGERLLVARRNDRGESRWESVRLDGTDPRVLAVGSVGRCGHPIAGKQAILLNGDLGEIVLLALDQSAPAVHIDGNPLDSSDCVAGDGELLAVTGRENAAPAVAIRDNGIWQLVPLPPGVSYAEPLVKAGRIVVALPDSPGRSTSGEEVPAAGAVYVLDKSGESWNVRARIVAAQPAERALFGFALAFDTHAMFVSSLTLGVTYTSAGAIRSLGEAHVCRAPWDLGR